MGKIVISTNTSLDGVVQDPDGREGSAAGGWFDEALGGDREAWAAVEYEESVQASALLLGRRSDEWFGSRWNDREGAWAERLRAMPKYVVSATATAACWRGGTVLGGDPVAEVQKLRQVQAGEILVYASYRLGRMLIEQDLVDEVRLVLFPVVVGAGERLFGAGSARRPMRLVESRRIGGGLLGVTYRPDRDM